MQHTRSSEPVRMGKRRRVFKSSDISMSEESPGTSNPSEIVERDPDMTFRSHSPNVWMSLATPPSANTWGTTPPNIDTAPLHFAYQTANHQQQPQGVLIQQSSNAQKQLSMASAQARSPSSPGRVLHPWGQSASSSPIPPPLFLDSSIPSLSLSGVLAAAPTGHVSNSEFVSGSPSSPPIPLQSSSRSRTLPEKPRQPPSPTFQPGTMYNITNPQNQQKAQPSISFGMPSSKKPNHQFPKNQPDGQQGNKNQVSGFDFRCASPILPNFKSLSSPATRSETVYSPFAPLRDAITNIDITKR